MRSLIRRVFSSSVEVNSQIVGQINQGIVVYIAFQKNDIEADLEWSANKILGLRVFEDQDRKMNFSVLQNNYELLLVSQFTLFGSVKKGFRPSFNDAASTELAQVQYLKFIKIIKNKFKGKLATGEFGKDMKINSAEDGPVTIWLDSQSKAY